MEGREEGREGGRGAGRQGGREGEGGREGREMEGENWRGRETEREGEEDIEIEGERARETEGERKRDRKCTCVYMYKREKLKNSTNNKTMTIPLLTSFRHIPCTRQSKMSRYQRPVGAVAIVYRINKSPFQIGLPKKTQDHHQEPWAIGVYQRRLLLSGHSIIQAEPIEFKKKQTRASPELIDSAFIGRCWLASSGPWSTRLLACEGHILCS